MSACLCEGTPASGSHCLLVCLSVPPFLSVPLQNSRGQSQSGRTASPSRCSSFSSSISTARLSTLPSFWEGEEVTRNTATLHKYSDSENNVACNKGDIEYVIIVIWDFILFMFGYHYVVIWHKCWLFLVLKAARQ